MHGAAMGMLRRLFELPSCELELVSLDIKIHVQTDIAISLGLPPSTEG
jgi:hypothetical protein